ncbi:hypothetical protein LEP1GSC008_4178 [Leptospira kirschneri serovar Bulgarica str. Nikolaevo]|uniref:Uncharacterized protein n=1 Tax=Leptospira kirschneri serovar Bulgarica str. Nikolaevo TaxID=1240687 RepID=M6F6Y0_9LEPT|nr:hypothetical protein LEP1GSC008_4178 [Leptospira kirschneri serovar Bulgarica str. Nikolaevo]
MKNDPFFFSVVSFKTDNFPIHKECVTLLPFGAAFPWIKFL